LQRAARRGNGRHGHPARRAAFDARAGARHCRGAAHPPYHGSPMSAPAVSVVIPCYNHRDTVAAAVESALAQTFADREIIVINDGSPDDTADVLAPYRDRIRYIEQVNAGQAAARNRGIELARGRYIALLDDDDIWPADKLEWQVAALDAEP